MISKKTIIILIVIIALLAGAYFAIDFMSREDTDAPSKNSEGNVSEVGSFMEDPIFETDKNSIVSVAITNSKESYEFVREGDMWKVKGNEDVLYNQGVITSLSYDYVSVTPILVVEENSDKASSFGFDSPLATSVVKTNDGKTAKFYLGDKTKGGNGYYFMMDGDKKIYTISMVIGNNMLKTLEDFRDKSIVNIDANLIKEVKMSVVGIGDVAIKRLEQPIDMMTSWEMTQPYEVGVYDDRFGENILTPMLAVSASVFLADNPTEKQLSESGLDNPAMYYEIITDKEKVRVNIGKNFDGEFAVKRDNEPTVYLVDSTALSFLYTDVLDYIQSFVYLPNYEDVSGIVSETKSGSYNLTAGEDKYSINGNEISKKKYTEYYQKLFDVKIQGIITAPPTDPENVVFSYTVNKKDGSSDKVSFINVNSKFAYVSVNDNMNFYVYNEDVDKASAAIEELYGYSKNPVDEASDETNEVESSFNWLALVVAGLVVLLVAAFPVSLLLNSKKKK